MSGTLQKKQTTGRGRKPLRLQVTIKREDYTNKSAFEYNESARKSDAHNFFLWNGGTHDHNNPFNLSKNVFQNLRCRESFSKEWALHFSKGWIKKWSFVQSRQGVNFSDQNGT